MERDWEKNQQEERDWYDVIIIGAGPSGMTASIYAARRGLKTLIIGGEVGGQMKWYSKMDYCTGVTHATLPDITDMFYEHVRSTSFSARLIENEKVLKITKKSDGFKLFTTLENTYYARTLIIAVGKMPRMLDVPGEEVAIHGKGMSICSSSDVPLYRGKKMVVIGGGDAAMDVCLQLSKLTNSIILMTDLNRLVGNPKRITKISKNQNIVIMQGVKVLEILLDTEKMVKGVRYSQSGGEEQICLCEGIFKEIGHTPDTYFLEDFLHINSRGEISTDRYCRTEYPGLFAAGNCTDQHHKQPIVAVGEGAIAAMEAHSYLQAL